MMREAERQRQSERQTHSEGDRSSETHTHRVTVRHYIDWYCTISMNNNPAYHVQA